MGVAIRERKPGDAISPATTHAVRKGRAGEIEDGDCLWNTVFGNMSLRMDYRLEEHRLLHCTRRIIQTCGVCARNIFSGDDLHAVVAAVGEDLEGGA